MYDTKLTLSEDVKKEIIIFYEGLMRFSSTSLPSIDRLVMQNGLQTYQPQKLLLTKKVNEFQTQERLWAIRDDKDSGTDGYIVFLFQKGMVYYQIGPYLGS